MSASAMVLSLAERAAAKKIFQNLLIQKHSRNIERVVQTFSPMGDVRVIAHVVESPLCSSSLLISQIVHFAVRNFIPPLRPIIKSFLLLVYEKNSNWSTIKDQRALWDILSQQKNAFLSKKARLETLVASFPKDAKLASSLAATSRKLKGTEALFTSIENEKIRMDVFPEHGIADNKLRGMMIQIKGANRGERATRNKKLIGCTESHSEGMRVFEAAKHQWTSRIGVYGLKVKTLYGNTEEYANSNACLHNGQFPFKVQERKWIFQ